MENGSKKIALISSANDPYVGQLSEMLDSMGAALDDYALKILDLGLSDQSKDMLSRFQADVQFLDPGWQLKFPGHEKAPDYKKVFVSKPFLPTLFPGYAGYIWIDADIWFQDASALEDYVAAGAATGSAFSFESHPMYRSIQKVRQFKVGNWVFIKGYKDYFFNKCRLMFGNRVAVKIGIRPVLNSGIFYMTANSPVWRAWQETMGSANLARHDRFTQICDQTCLQVALIQGQLAHGVLPASHNWLPGLAPPLLDPTTGHLTDPAYPHGVIKVLHLVDGGFNAEFDLPVRGGGTIHTRLRWSDYGDLQDSMEKREKVAAAPHA